MPAVPSAPAVESKQAHQVPCPHCGGTGKIDASSLSLGKMIAMRANLRGMKMTELAKKSGISKQVMTRILNDKMDIGVGKLIAIANALDCKVSDLEPRLG